MFRFFRLIFFIFSITLLGLTGVRAVQPAQTTGYYLTVYGSPSYEFCCHVYMIEHHTAHRVQVGTSQQPTYSDPVSPSGQWRVAYVRTGGAVRVYLMPTADHLETIRLGDQVGRSWQLQWSTQRDILYFLGWAGGGLDSALYRLSPEKPFAERLTPPLFRYVRTINEQPLPDTHFTPWVLLFWGVNLLLIASLMRKRKI